jgi:glycosyltransferase involved in cell wall biosynthesis
MRVLYVLERYPELSQTFVAQEIIGLQELGIAVDVVALEPGHGGDQPAPAIWLSQIGPSERLTGAARQAAIAPAATARQLMLERSWPPPAGTKRVRGLARLAPALRLAQAADHIHAHFATEAADMARLLSAASATPFSFTAHAADAYSDPSALAININAARFARAASGHVAEQLRGAAGEPGKIIELPIAVDTSTFEQLDNHPVPLQVLAVGRLVEKKGFSDLIKAFTEAASSFPQAQLLIAGDGPLREQLEAEIRNCGARISLLGALTNTRIAELMATSSIFALTPKTASNGDRDGRPAVIIEAMASGLPVLATSQPGIPEVVGAECGLLAGPGNVAQIAEQLNRMLSMTAAELAAIGEHGRRTVSSTYSRETVASQLASMFAANLAD